MFVPALSFSPTMRFLPRLGEVHPPPYTAWCTFFFSTYLLLWTHIHLCGYQYIWPNLPPSPICFVHKLRTLETYSAGLPYSTGRSSFSRTLGAWTCGTVGSLCWGRYSWLEVSVGCKEVLRGYGSFFFFFFPWVPKFAGYKGSETFDYGYRMKIFGSGAWRIGMMVTCRLWPVGNKEKRFWKRG